jgi:outer membrane protein
MRKSLLLAAATLLCATNVFAHEQNELFFRVGAASVQPDASSGTVLGGGVDVENATNLGFSGTWFINKHWGVEVLAALPFEHDIVGSGALKGVDIGSTKHLPPTISVQYYPLESDSFQPYVGLGLNYTSFFDTETTKTLDTALNGKTGLSLDYSTGIAYQLGADFKVSDNIYINAAVWKIDIDTTANIDVNGSHAASVDVSIDPAVFMLGVGFKY